MLHTIGYFADHSYLMDVQLLDVLKMYLPYLNRIGEPLFHAWQNYITPGDIGAHPLPVLPALPPHIHGQVPAAPAPVPVVHAPDAGPVPGQDAPGALIEEEVCPICMEDVDLVPWKLNSACRHQLCSVCKAKILAKNPGHAVCPTCGQEPQ